MCNDPTPMYFKKKIGMQWRMVGMVDQLHKVFVVISALPAP